MSEVATEPDAGADAKGAFYCPGCGKRYDTPGNCTGKDEAGHEPIAVEKVKGGKADDDGEAKPKPAAKRKTSSTSRSKRKTAGASK
jgi:hypothetical protein